MTSMNHQRHQGRDLSIRRKHQAQETATTRWWYAREGDGDCVRCGEPLRKGEMIRFILEDADGNKRFQHESERACWEVIRARRAKRRRAVN